MGEAHVAVIRHSAAYLAAADVVAALHGPAGVAWWEGGRAEQQGGVAEQGVLVRVRQGLVQGRCWSACMAGCCALLQHNRSKSRSV